MHYYISKSNDSIERFHQPLSHFLSYSNEMESYLFRKQIESSKEHDLKVEKEREMEFEDRYEEKEYNEMNSLLYFTSDNHRFYLKFPNILRSSLLIGIYSFLENTLTRLCKDIQKVKNYPVRYNSINGKGINKAKTYLSEVVQINFPANSNEWRKINDYRNIRNCFAHYEGIVNEDDKRLITSIRRLDSVNVEGNIILESKYIGIGRDFIENFIETIKDFWKMIEKQYLDILYPYYL